MTSTPNEPTAPDSLSLPDSPPDSPPDPLLTSDANTSPSWGTAPSTPPTGAGSDHTTSNATNNATSNATPPGARFFDGIRRLGIVRPDEGRWGAGVAAGIARRYGIDPVVVRIAFVVLTFLGGLGITLYALGWLFLPHPDGRIHAQQVLSGTVTAGFVGSLAVLLLSVEHALPLLLVALVVFLVVRHRRTSPTHVV